MAKKTILDPTAGRKSLPTRIRNFIQGTKYEDEELIKKVQDMGGVAPRYQNSIWNWQNGLGSSGVGFAPEINNMMRDPVISAAVNLLMTTVFQLNPDQKVFWPKSKYPVLVDELTKWHVKTLMQKRILTLGYNVVVWGNVPIKLIYDSEDVLSQYKFIGDYNTVIPIIVSGMTIGYLVDGEYHYPLEYVFAQSQYNHDLGGPLGHGLIRMGSMAYGTAAGGAVQNLSKGGIHNGSSDDEEYEIENEFCLAPSYVANAVRPWRNIKIIEDALLLARLDQSNYFRIFTVNVGASVDSKSAIRILNYYRSLFKKVRRVSYDSSGMSSQGGGNEFEVVIPKTVAQGGVEISDVGGQRDVKSLKDLDVQYQRLFASLNLQPSQIGFGQGQSSNINMGASPEEAWEHRWMRTCKSTLLSVLDAVKQIDLYYLRSKGYRVDPSDWAYGTVLQGQIDDHERNEALKQATENLKTLTETLNALQLPSYNKKYLVKSIIGPSLESIGIDGDTLLTETTQTMVPPISQNFVNFRLEELKEITSIIKLSGEFPKSLVASMEDYIATEDHSKDQILLSELSYMPKKISHGQILSGAVYLAYPSAELDIDSFFKRYSTLPENIFAFKDKKNIVSSIDISSQFLVPENLSPITVADLQNAGVASISQAIMLSPGAFIVSNREDIITLLYLKLNSSFTVIVDELLYADK